VLSKAKVQAGNDLRGNYCMYPFVTQHNFMFLVWFIIFTRTPACFPSHFRFKGSSVTLSSLADDLLDKIDDIVEKIKDNLEEQQELLGRKTASSIP
jgi:hypothetical protein